MQTRLLRFANAGAQPGPRSWQGATAAEWIVRGGGRGSPRFGTLKTVTANLRPGYLRKNGVPYSERAVFTEYWDVHTLPNGDKLLVDTNVVEDPVYLQLPFQTAIHYKLERDASKWDPDTVRRAILNLCVLCGSPRLFNSGGPVNEFEWSVR